jgi:hypothetical protein
VRFNLGKLNDMQVKEHYEFKIPDSLVAIENMDDNMDIIRVLGRIL